MRLSLRFILPLGIVLAAIAYALVPLVDSLTLKWFTRDMDIRSTLITTTMQEPLAELVKGRSSARIHSFFNRAIQDERLYAIGFCDPSGHLLYKTQTLPKQIGCSSVKGLLPAEVQAQVQTQVQGQVPEAVVPEIYTKVDGAFHVAAARISLGPEYLGQLVLVHDMSFVERRSADTTKYIFYLFAALAVVISLVTVIVAQLSWRGWISGMRSLLKGEGLFRPLSQLKAPELRPLAKDLRALIRDLESDRKTRDESQVAWSPQALRTILRENLAGDEILIVSNREPYIHNRKDGKIEVQVPASGLVTALEPVMRACSGTWIAHGSGSADREVVDKEDHVRVPPERPSYQIRRVWLKPEEEAGYYYGFANEGLWPLCHIAHTRPTFRTSDWKMYEQVNRKFAKAVVEEAKTDDPVILVQDYHFALLPRMIREKLPNATIITFWHIPWPNPEAFGICPWREDILQGLLGSSILGFHTRFHCNNFIDTVDRFLEARVDRETSNVSHGGKLTAVRQYPISIEWPSRWIETQRPVPECREILRKSNGMSPDRLVGIGVDRLDYTKGILERFLAVERLLEVEPHWIGRFTFVQVAAPSRSSIEQYNNFDGQVRRLADRINARFGRDGYQPICLKVEHHEPQRVFEYYRGADLCFVSSLHDGMNLVAKEFVASRDDERGVLILSQFTGASRELPEALIVNPYNIDQCAAAIHEALTMPPFEQRDRMRSMRGLIQEFNVYRWAGRMLIDAARMRQRSRLMDRLRESGGQSAFEEVAMPGSERT